MSVAEILPSEVFGGPVYPTGLHLVPAGEDFVDEPILASRRLLDDAFKLRDEAAAVEKVDGEQLAAIQVDVADWVQQSNLLGTPKDKEGIVEYYTDFSEERARANILGLVDYLATNHGDKVSPVELEATKAFVEAAFANYAELPSDGEEVLGDADGSFAFVVPARMSRQNTEYGKEVEPVIPAFRYLPNELRSQMMVGLPPFVIDTYKPDEYGRRGYLVFAPVTEDIGTDIVMMPEALSDSPNTDFRKKVMLAQEVATKNVNAAVDFAYRRFGVRVAGLGATLPAVTKYGQRITNPNVVTTTGHGGTTELINMTVESAMQGEEPESIGVLGLGSIGASIAHIIAERFPNTKINIYDMDGDKVRRTLRDAAVEDRFSVSASDGALIKESDIVVSAIVGRIDLQALGIDSIEGKKLIDDSQPGSFNPAQISERGGSLLWVIGKDSNGNVANRRGYDYATLLDAHTDVFGCEAEAASIRRYMDEMATRGMPEGMIERVIAKVALRGPVNPQGARYIAALFRKYGIVAAEPQAFGEPVTLR